MKRLTLSFLVLSSLPLAAGSSFEWTGVDVAVLGEVHDNPAHHLMQAEIVGGIQPKALVFEMLTEAQAADHIPGGSADALEAAFNWAESGWPDFSLYYPIFEAAPKAQVYGAGVPRVELGRVMEVGLTDAFGPEADAFGLSDPLPEDEQSAREAYQMAAHCDALPEDLLPMMVDMQRFRDAELARQTHKALNETGGPVVVITGNGHAREDWGMPVYFARIAPVARVVTLGQGEAGAPPDGVFDHIRDGPRPDREDPCAAFR